MWLNQQNKQQNKIYKIKKTTKLKFYSIKCVCFENLFNYCGNMNEKF